MKENFSQKFMCEYLTLADGYLTKDGILIRKDEHITIDEYKKKTKTDQLYDYEFAKRTDFLKPLERKEETVKEKLTKKGPFKIAALFISLVAMAASTYFTSEFLSQSGYNIVLAISLSLSMVSFTTMAFEAIVIFKQKKQYFFMFLFIMLWPIVLAFSMLSTIIVNYGMYETRDNTEAYSVEVIRYEQLIENHHNKIARQEEIIEGKRETIAYYEERDWGTLSIQRELEDEIDELSIMYDELDELMNTKIDNSIEVEEDFYTFMGRILNVEAGFLAFIVSILPAIFIDIIAPLAMAVTIFL